MRGAFPVAPLLTTLCTLMLMLTGTAHAATFNVTDYGAVPDDANHDLAAITATITAAGDGNTVYFPAGTYIISNTILPQTGQTLTGAGRTQTIVKFKYAGTSKVPMLKIQTKQNCDVSHITFNADNDTNALHGIHVAGGGNHTLHDLGIKNLASNYGYSPFGIYFTGNATNSMILSNRIENIGLDSEWGGGIRCANAPYNTIRCNTISETGRGGIFGNTGAAWLTIQSNTVSGSHGVGLGIEMWGGCPYALIEDNVIDHWLSIDEASFSAVRRNVVSAKDGTYKWCALEFIESSNCVFTGNTVDDGCKMGISSSNVHPKNHGFFAYNTVRHATTFALWIEGHDEGAQWHYYYKNKLLDTYQNHPRAYTESNAPNYGSGVLLYGNCRSITFDANEISGNGKHGINLYQPDVDGLSFVNNLITSNNNKAVYEGGGSAADLEWTGNTVNGNGTDNALTPAGYTNQKPTVSFTYQTNSAWNEIRFVSTATDTDGTIAHVLWDFGAGRPATETNALYAYEKAGIYRVTLVAWDNGGRGAIQEQIVNVNPPVVPTAPTQLVARVIGPSRIGLQWEDRSVAELGFKIDRRQDSAPTWTLAYTTVTANVTTWLDTGLAGDTRYHYQVRAYNGYGDSDPTQTASAHTRPTPAFTAYNDLSWTNTQRSANITWYTTDGGAGTPPMGNSGLLVDCATGLDTPVTLSVTGGEWDGAAHTVQGAPGRPGTLAHGIFDGVLDAEGVVSYAASNLVLTFSGFAPAPACEVALFGNRDKNTYTDRVTRVTIGGALSFSNAAATAIAGTDAFVVITNGYNTLEGHLAHFVDVDPGPDGTFTLTVDDGGSPSPPRFYANAVMLRAYSRHTTLVNTGAGWKFRRGTQEASSPHTAWLARTFDDQAWEDGTTPIGYLESGWTGGTELSDMRGNYTAVFLRRTFTLSNSPSAWNKLTLDVEYDDGFAAWLNGEEIARVNVPGTPGSAIPYDAVAISNARSSASFQFQAGAMPPVHTGTNVLALMALNRSLDGSSDCVLDARLHAVPGAGTAGTDADNDSLPDDWEIAWFGNTNAAAHDDSDSDGPDNNAELIAGTDPGTNTDWFAVDLQPHDDNMLVSFPTVTATEPWYDGATRTYALQQTTNLQPGTAWTLVPGYEAVPATGQTVSYTNQGGTGPIFFRARVWLAE